MTNDAPHDEPARPSARARGRRARLVELAREVAHGMAHDHTFHYAAGTAFRATLALFPLLLAIVALLSLLGVADRASDTLQQLAQTDAVPGKSLGAFARQLDDLDQPGPGRVLGGLVALALALWSGSAAMRTTMTALNEALEIDDPRSLPQRVMRSLGLAAFTATLAIGATLVVAFGPAIGEALDDAGAASQALATAWHLLRWPLVIGMVFTWLSVTYALGPGDRQGYKIVTPGIVSAFVLWLAFAVTFSWYVDQVSNQSKLYGTFTGLIALQLYVYWSCLIVLFGAELDNALSRRGGDAGT